MYGILHRLILSFLLVAKSSALFGQSDETRYLQNFDSIQAASYSVIDDPEASLPPGLLSVCKDKGDGSPPVREVVVQAGSSGIVDSYDVSSQCSEDSVCIIPFGTTFQVDTSVNLAALVVRGTMEWTDDTQVDNSVFLCAGYVAVEGELGKFEMHLEYKDAFVYIKDNGAVHSHLRSRAFGSTAMNSGDYPTIDIKGRDLARTWSLLAKPLRQGENRINLMHNANLMGWRVGDRIAVAPTAKLATGSGEEFTITSINENGSLLLNKAAQYDHQAEFINARQEGYPALLSAEVVNLSRNIVISGDDFKHEQCNPSLPEAVPGEETSVAGCRCASFRTKCTIGLHTAIMHGGTASIQNARIEKCGQRGVEGKYCLHFHKLHDCPTCLFRNNVVENSHQRGIIVHSTHSSVTEGNVLYNVRGAGIYIEDGNEMYNDIKHNVAICPHPFRDDVLAGCTVPGTSNRLADTADNHAGIFSRANTNSLQGNRVSNHFNGMFFLNDGNGRGESQGKVCETSAKYGRIEGNTFHSNGRFGTYTLTRNYPKVTDQSILTDGHNIDTALCANFDTEGNARGLSGAIAHNVDYYNAFVGHYETGDIQYNGHLSFKNGNNIYWKETKNFANGCSAHITGSSYARGNMALPDQATFIIENTEFGDGTSLEANHHCGVGYTGGLCQPQYILHNVLWKNTDTSSKWVWFQYQNFQPHNANQNHGGIFSLAPPDADAVMNGQTYQNSIFPEGFVSLVSSKYTYLLNLPGQPCVLSSTISSKFGLLYDNGIICKVPLRSLKVWTRGLDPWTAPGLQVELWYMRGGVDGQITTPDSTQVIGFHQIGTNTPKQGFSFPVIPGIDHSYRLSLTTGEHIPVDWIVEFSDPVMGNRYGVEYTNLSLNGRRRCGVNGLVSSQHDRRFIWSGGDFLKDEAWGNSGACSELALSDLPVIDCSSMNDGVLPAEECPEKCNLPCNEDTHYCDCGSSSCKPRQGFVEELELDLCAAARCQHGSCTATFLGGAMTVTSNACVCDQGWTGPLCQYNPCETLKKTCSGHGTCVALGHNSARCECDQGFSGEDCETSCDGICSGEWPYGCARELDGIRRYGCSGSSCFYLRVDEEYPFDGICTYKDGYTQEVCLCDDENDCKLSVECNPDGSCPPSEYVPDSTSCNSVPFGVCKSGVCVAESNSQPTKQPSNSPPTEVQPTSRPTNEPTAVPTNVPTNESTYCGCPQCTQIIWNTPACDDNLGGCYTCGGRIYYVESTNGGDTDAACRQVSNEFAKGPCGPVCNPEVCNGIPEPTKSPTSLPTREPTPLPSSSPSASPTNVPTNKPTSEQTYCGCPQCTETIWNTMACDDSFGGCYTCGGRISYVESTNGGDTIAACRRVSNEFADGPCDVCNPDVCNGTPEPTKSPTSLPTREPSPEPTHLPTSEPSREPTAAPTHEPTNFPTSDPTSLPSSPPSASPTNVPTNKPTSEQTYCGCPKCTETIWNTMACDDSFGGCYTCGGRISYVESTNGGDTIAACRQVSNEFADGPCGPVCNPDVCNGTPEPTKSPTPKPSSPPTPSPTPSPTTHSPTEQSFCGCSQCTLDVWNTMACRDDLGGCYTCGGRIEYVIGTGQSPEQACATVSDQFPSVCGPRCNPLLCEATLLDEPDSSKLIWSDEFDVDGAPDTSKWTYDIGDGCPNICGWGNNELQYYTNSNAAVANGILRITARKESLGGKEYTSARMVTRGLQAFRYGRIRFRAKLAGCTALGTWPAIWLLPEQWVYGGWPKSGEIDVMEAVGYEENKFHGSVHTESFNHGIGTQKTGTIIKPESDWHIFEIDWQVDRIRFAVDKEVYFEFAPDDINNPAQWPFNDDFHLIMNVAVGGNWGGLQGVDTAAFESDGQFMEIDWVRVYSM